MSYAQDKAPPRTMTRGEQTRLLELTGERRETFDDHVLFSLALGTGLRVFEIAALNCGQVYDDSGRARQTIVLSIFKGCGREGAPLTQEVTISDALRAKLSTFKKWKRREKQAVGNAAPLFAVPSNKRRAGKRRLSGRFEFWKLKHCFNGALSFHAMRHTFCQRVYELERDLLVVKRAARHRNVATTTQYTHATADDVLQAVNALEC